ncbi:MAG: radical SAM protein [Lachnospiraceae bacterium]|nr:radical SAM protein [Lachnospiraceae bacterium]
MKKPVCKYRLRSCVWEITLACCFSCRYCGSRGGQARPEELDTEECMNVADQLAELGCRRVSLIGGEIFMRADWAQIAGRLTDHGIRVSMITNGYLFSEQVISKLKGIPVESVAVSLDGPEDIHDKYRQNGSFRRAVQAIQTLTEHDIPVSVISTLNHENAEQLEELYQLLCQYPISAWQIQACSPMGSAADSGINYRFDHGEVIRFVAFHMFDAPFMMGVADNIGYYTEEEGYFRGNLSGKAVFTGCRAGLTAIGIDSVGNVRGCESMYDERFNEGNLRKKTLREIWESSDSFRYNRGFRTDLLTGRCSVCQHGFVCAGGCRAYNYFTHGQLYEAVYCARSAS